MAAPLQVGDPVAEDGDYGVILSIDGDEAIVEWDGVRPTGPIDLDRIEYDDDRDAD